jgi:SAM-dependent methyltransferase
MAQPYLSLEAELHDLFWEAEDDASEVKLMAAFLKAHPGPAIEMGSGSGRLMFPLVKQGHEIEGLELSEDMIALGKKRAAVLGVSAPVHHGDMTTWQGSQRYSSLLAPAFTLQLADDPAATLQHWHQLIVRGGGLYLTVFMPYAELLGDLPQDVWYVDHEVILPDGGKGRLDTCHRIDREARIVHREHRYTVTGTRPAVHESTQRIRWIEHREMLELLEKCGFQIEAWFLDFDPRNRPADPDCADFDGILTYHATSIARND